MNRRDFIKQVTVGAAALAVLPRLNGAAAEENVNVVFEPKDHGRALVNPAMGWTMHYYSNIISNYGSKLEPSDTLDDFPGLSTVYLRVPWSFIELEEGRFNWELLDTPAQRWIQKGKKVAFRITAQESWMRYATPEWVVKAGAQGYNVMQDRYWEPKYDDPVFLEKVENFVAAMARRYDGNPNVAFVDVGHYGMWGEGHTVSTTKIDYPLEVLEEHINIYTRHFKRTLLCISDDFAGHDKPGKRFPITDYAFSKGVSLRDDSIMVQPPPNSWYHAEMAQLFWPTLPVILEHEHYHSSLERKAWSHELFLKAVEDYHASYMSIHGWPRMVLEANREVIDKINRRMGYRIRLRKIEYPRQIKGGQLFTVRTKWQNAGVAPCYPGGFFALTLKDEKGGIVSVLTEEGFDMKNLPVGEPEREPIKEVISTFTVGSIFKDPANTFQRNLQRGRLSVYVSVGQRDGTPTLELPCDNDDGHKRYKVGEIELM